MKQVVWKFELENAGFAQDSTVMLPPGAKIVDFGYQEHPMSRQRGWFMWAVVDPDVATEKRRFVVLSTGATWEGRDLDHVMTKKEADGFVWHLLEWRRP